MRSDRIPILTYHSIGPGDGGPIEPYRTEPEVFAEHVAAMRDSGRRWVTVRELGTRLEAGSSVEGLGAVTFDDPFLDALDHGVSRLSGAGITSTVYAVSDRPSTAMAGAPPLASTAALRALPDEVEVGAHSVDHPELDVLAPREAQHQIAESRRALSEELGRPIVTFAYPHGYRSPRVRRLVRQEGFVAACGVSNSFSHAADDRFSLARVLIERDHSPDDIAELAAGNRWPVARRRDRPATVAWRWYRRARRRLR